MSMLPSMTRIGTGTGPEARGRGRAGVGRQTPRLVFACLLAASLAAARQASATSPYIWDDNGDGMDDRIETVHALGFAFAFENADTLAHQRIDVSRTVPGLVYGAYVIYGHVPTATDLAAIQALGLPVLYRFEAANALRSAGSFAQLRLAAALPGVERVEAVPLLYGLVREGSASIAKRDPTERTFPTWEGTGGADGNGVVIAFLDTGINDVADGVVSAHESLAGRFVGGAAFPGPDSTFDTPRNGSVNPADHGGAVTRSHATHVAGIALGGGGSDGYAVGVAPAARFVDVKVLSDAGSGTGLPEALDWCIHNRARNWGPPGFEGIDVINLSLAGTDVSDGNDLAAKLAGRATELGIVVVASMGNDGLAAHVPSPAAGDGVIAVGAYDAQRTPEAGDDLFASFSNRGPRDADGDGGSLDELKPDLLAPGVAVLSANGDPGSDGHQYRRLNGTSMSAAFVSGAAACLRSAAPSLSPAAIGGLLRATARRDLGGVPGGPAGADPRWQAAKGFGALDLYGAKLELEQPQRSQVVRLELDGDSDPTAIAAVAWTQRERGAPALVMERAADLGGSPGAFAEYDSAAAVGDSSLADLANRTAYGFSWPVPPAERGNAFWYRVAYTEGGVRYASPARRFTSPSGTSLATLEWTIVHNALDHDLAGQITAGPTGDNRSATFGATPPSIVLPLPGTGAAESSDWVDGLSTLGNVAWTFRQEIANPDAAAFLPPTVDRPWRMALEEAGYLNRGGRIAQFRLTWHAPGGDQVFDGGPVPQQTLEGAETVVGIPAMATDVTPRPDPARVRYGPNPLRAGGTVSFALDRGDAIELRVYDLAGREVGRTPFTRAGDGARATWRALGADSRPLPPGVYLARAGEGRALRLVVLSP